MKYNEITLFLFVLTFRLEIIEKIFLSEPANFSASDWLEEKFPTVQKKQTFI